jgi:hypothetical protein
MANEVRKGRTLVPGDSQTGGSNIYIDRRLKALAPGKRESADGSIYYEYRRNRSDLGDDEYVPLTKAPVKKAPVKKAPVKKAPLKKAPVKKASLKNTNYREMSFPNAFRGTFKFVKYEFDGKGQITFDTNNKLSGLYYRNIGKSARLELMDGLRSSPIYTKSDLVSYIKGQILINPEWVKKASAVRSKAAKPTKPAGQKPAKPPMMKKAPTKKQSSITGAKRKSLAASMDLGYKDIDVMRDYYGGVDYYIGGEDRNSYRAGEGIDADDHQWDF